MKTGRYSLYELLTHNEIDQIIIPEIQRDYVWTKDNVEKLLESIIISYQNKEACEFEIKVNGVVEENNTVNEFLKQEFERLKYHQKLGFIYAYHDREYAGKFFLIDGQQRITTLYLLLLNLYALVDKADVFRAQYYKSSFLKVDYKVREQSHNFLKLLVDDTLAGRSVNDSKFYYSADYDNDVTIQNLIKNSSTIKSRLEKENLNHIDFLNYVENFIELNYFDTHLSEQGEQLYIYMNSRGEQLSYQELLRAKLMQKYSAEKKKEIGLAWERWQNFFWQQRDKNENADLGFQEFLKWATILHIYDKNGGIENFTSEALSLQEIKHSYLRIYRTSEEQRKQREALFKYQTEHIDFDFLSDVFDAVEQLSNYKSNYITLPKGWLYADMLLVSYVVILPVLQFIKQNRKVEVDDLRLYIERVSMYTKNLTNIENISKNPDTATFNLLQAVSHLHGSNIDILSLLSINPKLIIKSELGKFEIYSSLGEDRERLEHIVWDITNDEKFCQFLMGDISILFNSVEQEGIKSTDSNYLYRLKEYAYVLKKYIFQHRDEDRLRRLMLCHLDYSQHDGYGGGLERYSLIEGGVDWVTLNKWHLEFNFKDDESGSFRFSEFLKELIPLKNYTFEEIFEKHKNNYVLKDWREPFIKDYRVLQHCEKNMYLWVDDHRIILLNRTQYSTTHSKEIQCKLLESGFQDLHMYIYKSNCCVLNYNLADGKAQMKDTWSNAEYALDFIYKPTEHLWSLIIHNRIYNEVGLPPIPEALSEQGWIYTENKRYAKLEFYKYDINLSLMENTEAIALKTRGFIANKLDDTLLCINNEILKVKI